MSQRPLRRLPIAEIAAKRFEQQNVGVRVDVQTGGSLRGIADAKTCLSAILHMSSRNLKPEEAAELKEWVLAKDGICFLVHKDNPVRALTNDQIKAIYTGAIGNWKQVGGADRQLVAINRADGRAELEQFSAFFKLKPEEIKAARIAGENQQGIKWWPPIPTHWFTCPSGPPNTTRPGACRSNCCP